MKQVLRVVVLFIVVFTLGSLSVHALGEPQIVSVNPTSPQPVGARVVVQVRINNWDGETRSSRVCFRDSNWCQEAGAEHEYTRTFDTSPLSPGIYTIFVQVASQGDNSWSNTRSVQTTYELSPSQAGPRPVSLSVSPTRVEPNQTVSVTWNNPDPSGNDWISLHPLSDSDANSGHLAWSYANGCCDTLNFTAPGPGEYHFRFFRNGIRMGISTSFTVVSPPAAQPQQPAPVQQPADPPSPPASGSENQQQQSGNSGGNTNVQQPAQSGANQFGSGDLQLDGGFNTSPSGLHLQIVAGQLNVRSGPGVDFPIIGKARHDGFYTIVGGPQNGWYQISYNGSTGWVNGGPSYVSVGGNTQSDSCVQVLPPRLSTGTRARVTGLNNTPNRLRQSPSLNAEILDLMDTGFEMDVIGGPTCADGYWWWQVSTPYATGWTAEADNESYWLELLGTSHQQNANVPIEDIVVIPYEGPSSSYTINLRVNVSTFVIENGSEFVLQEITRIQSIIDNLSIGDKVSYLYSYLHTNTGTAEQIRQSMERLICNYPNVSGCSTRSLKMHIGSRITDMSAYGNIAYGYFVDRYFYTFNSVASIWADYQQQQNNETQNQVRRDCGGNSLCYQLIIRTIRDNSDDASQITAGRLLSMRVRNREPLNEATLNLAASEADLW